MPVGRFRMSVTTPAANGSGGGSETGSPPERTYPMVAGPMTTVLLVLPIVAASIAALVAPNQLASPIDATATLALIAGASLAIERALEVFWTVVGSRQAGQWWPFSAVQRAFDDYEAEANELFGEPLTEVLAVLDKAADEAEGLGADSAAVARVVADTKAEADRLRSRYEAARKNLPKGSGRLQVVSETIDDAAAFADHVLDEAKAISSDIDTAVAASVNAVTDSCKQLTDVIQSFDENPARKLASLSFGVSAGLIVAAVLGTNMFTAILDNADDLRLALDGKVGVLVTGVIVGLGSNPTHEVIKALERRKADRAATVPEAPTVVQAPVTTHRMAAVMDTRNLLRADSLAITSTPSAPAGGTPPSPDPGVRLSVPASPTRTRRIRSTS
jgi:hypothetical protein